ncbi:hypothetical protein GCM10027521_24150 [Amycolatopsis cihanbeyliensis]
MFAAHAHALAIPAHEFAAHVTVFAIHVGEFAVRGVSVEVAGGGGGCGVVSGTPSARREALALPGSPLAGLFASASTPRNETPRRADHPGHFEHTFG